MITQASIPDLGFHGPATNSSSFEEAQSFKLQPNFYLTGPDIVKNGCVFTPLYPVIIINEH